MAQTLLLRPAGAPHGSLPPKAELWSASVAGRSVQPAKSDDALLVPLMVGQAANMARLGKLTEAAEAQIRALVVSAMRVLERARTGAGALFLIEGDAGMGIGPAPRRGQVLVGECLLEHEGEQGARRVEPRGERGGALGDVAPTLCGLMNWDAGPAMTGKPLL